MLRSWERSHRNQLNTVKPAKRMRTVPGQEVLLLPIEILQNLQSILPALLELHAHPAPHKRSQVRFRRPRQSQADSPPGHQLPRGSHLDDDLPEDEGRGGGGRVH